jgi:hypothetical protein
LSVVLSGLFNELRQLTMTQPESLRSPSRLEKEPGGQEVKSGNWAEALVRVPASGI